MGNYTTGKTTQKRDKCIQRKQSEISALQAEIARLNARVAELEATKTTLKKSVTFCGQPIMRIADVSAATAKPVPSIYRESREGTFPKPIQLGKRRQAWLKSDIDEWMQQCLQHRKGGAA